MKKITKVTIDGIVYEIKPGAGKCKSCPVSDQAWCSEDFYSVTGQSCDNFHFSKMEEKKLTNKATVKNNSKHRSQKTDWEKVAKSFERKYYDTESKLVAANISLENMKELVSVTRSRISLLEEDYKGVNEKFSDLYNIVKILHDSSIYTSIRLLIRWRKEDCDF